VSEIVCERERERREKLSFLVGVPALKCANTRNTKVEIEIAKAQPIR